MELWCGPHRRPAVHSECAPSTHVAQQARSNSALRSRAYHHASARLLWCNALLREGAWWALWWGSLDGMQGVMAESGME